MKPTLPRAYPIVRGGADRVKSVPVPESGDVEPHSALAGRRSPRARRELLDPAQVWADRRAHRATLVASDVTAGPARSERKRSGRTSGRGISTGAGGRRG